MSADETLTLRIRRKENGGHVVEVNGVDLAPYIPVDGLRIEAVVDEDNRGEMHAHIDLIVDDLDIDLDALTIDKITIKESADA